MEISSEQRAAYRKVLLAPLQAVRDYRGDAVTGEIVLAKLCEAEAWIAATFPGRSVREVEQDLVKRVPNPKSQVESEAEALTPRDTSTFQEILGRCDARLPKITFRWDSVEEFALFLGIPFRKLNQVLAIPHATVQNWRTEPDPEDTRPVKFQHRVQEVVYGLRKIGVHTDDLIMHEGILNDGQRRVLSYTLIEIPRIGAEILVCNQIGEATFVSNRPLGIQTYLNSTKSQLQEFSCVKRVVRYGDDAASWLHSILEHLKDNKDSQVRIFVKDFVNLRSAIQAIHEPVTFLAMSQEERSNFRIANLGLAALASKFGFRGNPSNNKSDLLLLAARIWGEEHPVIGKLLTKYRQDQQLLSELGTDPQRWTQYISNTLNLDALHFSNLSQREKLELKIAGLGIQAIATIFGVKGDPISSTTMQVELAAKLWGEEHPDLKENLIKVRKNELTLEKLKAEPLQWVAHLKAAHDIDAVKFLALSKREAVRLEVAGLHLRAIAQIFDVKGDPSSNFVSRLDLAAKLWGEDNPHIHPRLIKAREELKLRNALGTDAKRWALCLEEELHISASDFVALSDRDRLGLKVAGLGISAIASRIGLAVNPFADRLAYLELAAKLWGESNPSINIPLIQARRERTLLDSLGRDREKWASYFENVLELSVTQFLGLRWTELRKLHVAGLGIRALASQFDIPFRKGNSMVADLAAAIWGAEHPEVRKALLKIENDEKVRRLLGIDPRKWASYLERELKLGPLEFATLPQSDRSTLKVGGLGLKAICGKFGVKGNPISHSSVQRELAGKLWGEDHPKLLRAA